MKLAVICAHAGAACLGEALLSWGGDVPVFLQDGRDGILPAYQRGFEATTERAVGPPMGATGPVGARLSPWSRYDVLAYFHDDLILKDPDWARRVLTEFEAPNVGLVGFGGALGHGSPALYKESYDYHQLGRSHFMSNMDDAEAHGERFTGSRYVAVLDGFAMIVRRAVLEKAGGWPVSTLGYVGYDYWLSCMTRRLGYRIRLVGLPCHHIGGQTFVKMGLGRGPEHWEQFLKAHEFIYDEFRSELPFEVPR